MVGHVHSEVVDGIIVNTSVSTGAAVSRNPCLGCHAAPLEGSARIEVASIVVLVALHPAARRNAGHVRPVINTTVL